MGFRIGAYATVWEIKDGSGNWTDVKLSISKKNRYTGEYETDFNSYIRFIGGAAEKADRLTPRTRIKIGECDVTNHYDKEKGVTYTNYAVFDFEYADETDNRNDSDIEKEDGRKYDRSGFVSYSLDDDEGLPFN